MTDIEIFLKYIDLIQLAYEPNLSEEFIEKYILPNHLQYDKDHRVSPCYCLGQFIQNQIFSEEFIEKHIEDFLPGMSSIFRHQQISFDFIKKYFNGCRNYPLDNLLENNKIKLPIDFLQSKLNIDNDHTLIKVLEKYDLTEDFIRSNFLKIKDIYFCNYGIDPDDHEYFIMTKSNAKIFQDLLDKDAVFK